MNQHTFKLDPCCFVAALLVGWLGTGCGSTPTRPPSAVWVDIHDHLPTINWGFINATDVMLTHVGLDYAAGDIHLGTGPGGRGDRGEGDLDDGKVLIPSPDPDSPAPYGSATFGPAFDPLPGVATVTWRTPDGQRHEQQVEVLKNIPDVPHFKGTVWFKIRPGGVQVFAESQEASWRRAAQLYGPANEAAERAVSRSQ